MKRNLTIGVLILAGVLAISTGIGIAAARSADAKSNIQAGLYAPGDGVAFADETVGQWYCGGRGAGCSSQASVLQNVTRY
jgi:hypothetical protein